MVGGLGTAKLSAGLFMGGFGAARLCSAIGVGLFTAAFAATCGPALAAAIHARICGSANHGYGATIPPWEMTRLTWSRG